MVSWADIYAEANRETKKMIIGGIVQRVTISKGYEIKIELKIDKAQFEDDMIFDEKNLKLTP